MTFDLPTPETSRQALALLPRGLAARARELNRCFQSAGRCPACRTVARLLTLACGAAALKREETLLRSLVTEALHYHRTGYHNHGLGGFRRLRPVPSLAGAPLEGRYRGSGQVERWIGMPGPTVAATDAGWREGFSGFGYLTNDGRWGFRGWPPHPSEPSGPSRVTANELGAVHLLLARTGPVPDLVLLVDSVSALGFLRAWRAGRTGVMPAGYSLRPRRAGRPTLVKLAERVSELPGLRLKHVRGHTGHPLNEAAHALATLGRRRTTETFDAVAHAGDVVDAALWSWYRTAAA